MSNVHNNNNIILFNSRPNDQNINTEKLKLKKKKKNMNHHASDYVLLILLLDIERIAHT